LTTAYESQIKSIAEMKPINSDKLQSAMDGLSEQLHMATTTANEGFVGNIKKASTSLDALNTAYESQLKAVAEMKPISNEKLQMAMDELSNKLHASVADLSSKIHTSVETLSGQVQSGTEQINNYHKQMQALTTNISALNNIYGNMLSAMTNIKA